jgi:hypothetical protein
MAYECVYDVSIRREENMMSDKMDDTEKGAFSKPHLRLAALAVEYPLSSVPVYLYLYP